MMQGFILALVWWVIAIVAAAAGLRQSMNVSQLLLQPFAEGSFSSSGLTMSGHKNAM